MLMFSLTFSKESPAHLVAKMHWFSATGLSDSRFAFRSRSVSVPVEYTLSLIQNPAEKLLFQSKIKAFSQSQEPDAPPAFQLLNNF